MITLHVYIINLFFFSYLFQDHLELQNSTLHLAVNILDKFLSTQTLSVSKLQLVGVTCLFIAAKYLERFPPQVSAMEMLNQCNPKLEKKGNTMYKNIHVRRFCSMAQTSVMSTIVFE